MKYARTSDSKVYFYFMKKGRQSRHRIPRDSCLKDKSKNNKMSSAAIFVWRFKDQKCYVFLYTMMIIQLIYVTNI